jgi:hypothetical protein
MRDLEKMLPLHLHLDEKQLDLDINMSVSYIFCAFMILAVSPEYATLESSEPKDTHDAGRGRTSNNRYNR